MVARSPGRRTVADWMTCHGVGSAALGTVVARALQVGFAIVVVALANMLTFTRLAGGEDKPRRRGRRSQAKRVP